jgi:hypothetical protein
MAQVMAECLSFCKDMKKQIDNGPSTPRNNGEKSTSSLNSSSEKKGLNGSIFKDEVPYLKYLMDYAIPFLEDCINSINTFSVKKTPEMLIATRKSLFNWKNNPENNEKYLRKEFRKSPIQNEFIDDSRSLLGVQQPPEWLENLNIGTIMHMKPLRYKDYAQKKEVINEVTKDSLQEKAIFQSLIYFTTATEMRFQEMAVVDSTNNMNSRKASKDDLKSPEVFRSS